MGRPSATDITRAGIEPTPRDWGEGVPSGFKWNPDKEGTSYKEFLAAGWTLKQLAEEGYVFEHVGSVMPGRGGRITYHLGGLIAVDPAPGPDVTVVAQAHNLKPGGTLTMHGAPQFTCDGVNHMSVDGKRVCCADTPTPVIYVDEKNGCRATGAYVHSISRQESPVRSWADVLFIMRNLNFERVYVHEAFGNGGVHSALYSRLDVMALAGTQPQGEPPYEPLLMGDLSTRHLDNAVAASYEKEVGLIVCENCCMVHRAGAEVCTDCKKPLLQVAPADVAMIERDEGAPKGWISAPWRVGVSKLIKESEAVTALTRMPSDVGGRYEPRG